MCLSGLPHEKVSRQFNSREVALMTWSKKFLSRVQHTSILAIILILLLNFHGVFAATNAKNAAVKSALSSAELEPGYIQVTKKDQLFYLLAKSHQANAPLVIYLAGGPGASSLIAAFVANGPWDLASPFLHDTHFELKKNPWAWNQIANVVYLDQPRYVGYSYGNGPYVTSLSAAGKDFITWLKAFYQQNPQFRQRPLYLTGESFAGIYIAEYAHQILQYNHQHVGKMWDLRGVFIQSGVLDDDDRHGFNVSPQYQLNFLCKNNLLPNHACNARNKLSLQDTLTRCVSNLAHHKNSAATEIKIVDLYIPSANADCKKYLHETTLHSLKQIIHIPDSNRFSAYLRGKEVQQPTNALEFYKNSQIRRYLNFSPNPYNVQLECEPSGGFPPWCYDNYKINRFLNDPILKSILGDNRIPAHYQWQFAKFLIPLTLIGQNPPIWPTESRYVELLNNHIKVVVVYGKNDWNAFYLGGQAIANDISTKAYGKPLSPNKDITTSPKAIPLQDNQHQKVGEYLIFKNFTFAQIDNAGHMVGMDQPEAVYILFSQFLQKNP